jgi:predicted phosphodiesterase
LKILCTGDWHIRETNPEYRIDDFKTTLKNKLKYILNLYDKHDCDLLLQPGDFFDYADRVSYQMLSEWLEFFKNTPKIFTILGQHDTKNHSLLNTNIPAYVFDAGSTVKLLKNSQGETYLKDNGLLTPKGMPAPLEVISLYKCHYGEKIPKVIKNEMDIFKVLVIHKMIIKSKKLWEGQEEYNLAKSLLKKYNYDLIVSGDNHTKFIETYEDKTLINMGSLMRTAKNQQDHQPAVVIFDTETREYIEELIPIESFDEVFDINRIEKETVIKKELTELVEVFEEQYETTIDFLKNLNIVKKTADADTLEIFNEISST